MDEPYVAIAWMQRSDKFMDEVYVAVAWALVPFDVEN